MIGVELFHWERYDFLNRFELFKQYHLGYVFEEELTDDTDGVRIYPTPERSSEWIWVYKEDIYPLGDQLVPGRRILLTVSNLPGILTTYIGDKEGTLLEVDEFNAVIELRNGSRWVFPIDYISAID